jgi:hypothetical protein
MTARLLDRVFRPDRPQLAVVRAALRGIESPAAAWEALAARGLLPAAWLAASRRWFPSLPGLPPRERAERLRWAPFVPRAPVPDDVVTCALFAAGAAGVERAEAHGLALCAALLPWDNPPAEGVLWVPTSLGGYDYQLHDTKPDVWEPDAVLWRLFPDTRWEDVCRVTDGLAPPAGSGSALAGGHAASAIAGWLVGHERWKARVKEGARIPHEGPPGAAGRLYAELPDPFAEALRVFETGHAPLPSGNGALVLGYVEDSAPGK